MEYFHRQQIASISQWHRLRRYLQWKKWRAQSSMNKLRSHQRDQFEARSPHAHNSVYAAYSERMSPPSKKIKRIMNEIQRLDMDQIMW